MNTNTTDMEKCFTCNNVDNHEHTAIFRIEQQILSAIEVERRAQDAKWGVEHLHAGNPHEYLAWIGEELGEACKAVNEGKILGVGKDTYHDELIQVAALCVKALVAMELQKAKNKQCISELFGVDPDFAKFAGKTVVTTGADDLPPPLPGCKHVRFYNSDGKPSGTILNIKIA
jgi:NTP pyrophosphatase (non-canonical NTP hydrolase)